MDSSLHVQLKNPPTGLSHAPYQHQKQCHSDMIVTMLTLNIGG